MPRGVGGPSSPRSVIKVLTVLSGVLFFPQKIPKSDHFRPFSGWSEPSVVGDYKKSVSRAIPASMSLESLFHNANYGETMAENC